MKIYYTLILTAVLSGNLQASEVTTVVETLEKKVSRPSPTTSRTAPRQDSVRELDNRNCSKPAQRCLKEIEETKKTLDMLNSENGKIPISTKRTYEEYLADLLKLHTRIRCGEELNVEEEIHTLSTKAFNPGIYF